MLPTSIDITTPSSNWTKHIHMIVKSLLCICDVIWQRKRILWVSFRFLISWIWDHQERLSLTGQTESFEFFIRDFSLSQSSETGSSKELFLQVLRKQNALRLITEGWILLTMTVILEQILRKSALTQTLISILCYLRKESVKPCPDSRPVEITR